MLWVLFSILVGLLWVHFLEGEGSGAIVALTATLFSTVVGSLVDVARLVVGGAAGVPLFALTNWLMLTRLLGLVAVAILVHEFSVEFLELIDLFTRRVLSPSVHGLYSLSFLARVAYEPAAVVWNIWLAVSKTVTYGSAGLITKCSIDLLVDLVKGLLELFMITARAFFHWLGAGSGGGTLLTNDFPWVSVFQGVQDLILASTKVFECACSEVSNVYKIPVAMLTAPAAPYAVSHYLNVPLSLVQQLLDTLRFESFPTFKKTFYHLSGSIHMSGRWADEAILGGASVLLSEVLRLDPIPPEVRPSKFVGSMYAALAQSALQALYLVVRTTIHFALPLLLTDASYLYSVVSPREISLWLREAVNAATLSMYWLLEFSYARVSGGPLPAPRLDCAFEPAFYGDRLFQSLFCAARTLGRAATTGLAIASTVPVELTIMSLLSQERNAWQVAQRFQGPLRFTEPFVNSCELRKAVAAPTGFDLSTDAAQCDCRDEDALWEVPEFDPDVWSSLTGDRSVLCAQPQLEDMLRDVRDASEHAANLASPFLAPIVRVWARTGINVVSTGTRLALSLSDILNGDFFELPLSGTGAFGAREDLALAKWVSEGNAAEDSACPEGFVRETALTNNDGNPPCLEIHDVARLHYARARRYNSAAGLCRHTNSDSRACLCNPALPMLPDSTCSCNLLFSDDAITHADSYGEARWRHNGFRERGWCGTQILEPLFRAVEEESGDAVLSLVNGLFPGKVDFCGTQEYRVTETDVSTFTEAEFERTWLPDRAKWDVDELRDQVKERVERRQLQRFAAGLQNASGVEEDDMRLEETRHVVKLELGERALHNATNICYKKSVKTSAFRATCLVDAAYDRAETLAEWRDTQCVLYGNHEVVCSMNAVVKEGVKVWVGLSRQIWNGALAVVTGHPLSVEFDVGNRLCNTQRYFAAQASTLAAFLPVKPAARKAIAKFIFYLLEVQVESAYLFNQALVMVDDLVKGLFLKDTTADKAVHAFIENIVMSVFKYWAAVLTSMAELVEAYETGGGAILYSLAEICKLVGFGVKDILLDTVMVYAKLFGNLMRVFSGDVSKLPELIRLIIIALKHTQTILPKIAMETVGVILQALGPVGKFISGLVGSLCWTLEQIFNGIAIAINTITLGSAGMEENNDFSCLSQSFGADADAEQNDAAVNGTLRRRSMQVLPQAIAELGWTGNSFCDGVARGYADLTWRALRPLEKETLLSCLRQRHMGTQIAQQLGILSLQNVVYDWTARLHAVHRLSRTLFAYLEGLTPQQTRAYLTPLEMREYLPAVRRGWSLATTTFTPQRGATLLQTLLGEVATVVQDTGDTGALLVRVVRGWSNVSTRAAQAWDARNGTAAAYDAVSRLGHRFARAYASSGTAPASTTRQDRVPRRPMFSHPVVLQARRKLRTVADHASSVAHDAHAFLLGAAGVSSDVNPCDSAFSVVCLNCKLLDNVLETLVEELVRGALFFRYVYVEVTIRLFMEHVRGRALLLRDGLVNGAKNMFTNVEIARPENVAAQFDRLVHQAGAATAYAAVEFAKNAGNAMGVLETAAASTAADAYNRTSPTSASLDALRARGADAYVFGADNAPNNNIADLMRRDREFPQQLARRSFEQRTAIDWNYLLQNFPYVPANTAELANPDVQLVTMSVVRAFAVYLSTTDESYCPLFGHGLFYSLSRPLLSTCDMDGVIYSRDSTQTERMERADAAAWTTLYAVAGIVGFSVYTGLPLFGVLAPVALTALWYLWMYNVYGFSVNCAGSLPVQLAADVGAYINRWHPEAVCARFSALSATPCDPYGDLAFANQTQWRDCVQDDEAVRELGYFYSLAYYTHAWLPDQWTWVRQTQPFRYWLSDIRVLDLLEEDSVPMRENCARLLFLDQIGVVSVGGVLLWLVYTLLLPPLTAIARAAAMVSLQTYGLANLLVISITRSEKTY